MGQKQDTHRSTAMMQHDYAAYRYGDDEDRQRRKDERARYNARHACRRTKMMILMNGDK